MKTTSFLTPLIVTILLLSKANGEDNKPSSNTSPNNKPAVSQLTAPSSSAGQEHNVEKRHVSSLLGDNKPVHIPYHSFAAAATANGGNKRNPSVTNKSSLDELAERLEEAAQEDKRYLGALARTGDLRVVARDGGGGGLRQEKRGEDLDSLIDELATAEELRRMQLREDLFEEEPDKRSVVSLARSGYLKPTTHDFIEDDADSSYYAGDPDEDKRGGIASLARNGYYQKRPVDAEFEQLMSEVYGIGEKRSVASLARSYNLPNSVKGNYENEETEKRNLPSLLRDRTSPLGEGKRHIGSFVANHGIPFVNNAKDNGGKRNVGALARNRDFPYAVKFGKRDASEEEGEEMSKRYVATLLRQGRLPVGADPSPDQSDMMSAVKDEISAHDADSAVEKDEIMQQDDGSAKITMRKKRAGATSGGNILQSATRTKREIPDEFAIRDDDSMAQFVDDAEDSPINKRYFGVRGGGKMPGGRLPKVGGRRTRNDSNGRRRHN